MQEKGTAAEEIQLTTTSYVVLGLISAAGEATPYDLKQMAAFTIGNFFSIPHSQIYAEPQRLAAAGFLNETREETGRRRKHYSLTDAGRKAFNAWLATPTEQLYELRDPGLLKLAFGSDPAALAAVQVGVHKARVTELQSLLVTLDLARVPAGARLVVEAGLGHEKEYVRFWSRLLKEK
jgi:PadR family transcriptional regulator, regulatory protein AphA